MTFEDTDGTGNHFKCHSDSGKVYRIDYRGSGDADPEYVSLWECSCPGYRFRGNCKHIVALGHYLDSMSGE